MCRNGLVATHGHAASVKGSGRLASEQRTTVDFDTIVLKGSLSVEVRQTGKESVTVTADDNLLALVETQLQSGPTGRTLTISMRSSGSYFSKNDIKVEIGRAHV